MLYFELWIPFLSVLLYSTCCAATQRLGSSLIQTSVFLSPPFYLKPGTVQNKFYYSIPFPKGHIAIKSFNGEVVDENGNPVPLHETYLHHWAVGRYYGQKGPMDHPEKFISIRNSGPCENIGQYFGLGSETRKTNTWVPHPYGIEVGNPTEIPEGYDEKWLLNVHAIDTRGVEDRLGCTECKCSLYNVTADQNGRPLAAGYVGGLHCCYDDTQCRVNGGFGDSVRKLYLRYTVKWVEWNPSIVPVKIYILDVTDIGDRSRVADTPLRCKVEYNVPSCDSAMVKNEDCIDVRKAKVALPHGGDIIYGVAHQHTGGTGSALYGEDGRLLCSSNPFYGTGEEPGDEANYIVGMSTCYPKPGFLNIKDGEVLTVVSNYSNAQMHTGVMGLFYILVAKPQQKLSHIISQGPTAPWFMELGGQWWAFLFVGGIVIAVVAIVAVITIAMHVRRHKIEGYHMVAN